MVGARVSSGVGSSGRYGTTARTGAGNIGRYLVPARTGFGRSGIYGTSGLSADTRKSFIFWGLCTSERGG